MTPDEYAARVQAVRDAMRNRGLSMLLLVSPENIYYLIGLDHHGYFAFTCLLLLLEDPPILITRAMEAPTVTAQVPWCIHVAFNDDEDPAQTVANTVRKYATDSGGIGLEQQTMYFPPALWARIHESLPHFRWEEGSGVVEPIRAVKSPSEIAFVKRAALASDRAIQSGLAAAGVGVSEREIAAAVYHELIMDGTEPPGFAPLIRSSENLFQEHVSWSARLLGPGDTLFTELSASVARYHAPLTRMVHIVHAPAHATRSVELAMEGLLTICRALQPGAISGDVYGAWQEAIARGLGHASYQRQHCGYMIGIGFPPSWVGGSAVVGLRRGGDFQIREAMVFHVLSWLRTAITRPRSLGHGSGHGLGRAAPDIDQPRAPGH